MNSQIENRLTALEKKVAELESIIADMDEAFE